MSYNSESLVQSSLRTVDALTHDLFIVNVPENGVVRTDIWVLAKSLITGLAASWNIQLCVKRNGSGNAVMVQGNNSVINILKDANWTVQVVAVGSNAVIQVKGVTGTIIDWQFSGSHISFVPPLV